VGAGWKAEGGTSAGLQRQAKIKYIAAKIIDFTHAAGSYLRKLLTPRQPEYKFIGSF
jgi:hypothetical protein